MNELIAAVRQLLLGLRLWVTVTPWEQAIRVRLGRKVTLLEAGIHLKIPLLDMIYLQSVRMRITELQRQTVTSQDGHTITTSGCLGYSVLDIAMLYKTLHHPDDTITNLARAAIAQYISTHPIAECRPAAIEENLKALDFSAYGISAAHIYVTEFVVVRTYRVIGDYSYGSSGAKLSTDSLYTRTPAS